MKAPARAPHLSALQSVATQLAARLDEPPDRDALARLAAISPRQLDRLFLRHFGESLSACSRRLRLERAAHQLRESSAPLLAIALAAGYGSHEAFTRAFRGRFAVTPSDYRARPGRRPARPEQRWREALAGAFRVHAEQLARLSRPTRQKKRAGRKARASSET